MIREKVKNIIYLYNQLVYKGDIEHFSKSAMHIHYQRSKC